MCIKSVCAELFEIDERDIIKGEFLLDPQTEGIHLMNEDGRLVGDDGLLNQFLESEEIHPRISQGYCVNQKIYIVRFFFSGILTGILEVHTKLKDEEKKSRAYLAALNTTDIASC